ncbi:MAG TPA: MarR family transcriptional regulator [Actinotalea sp.]|nr:MarR family transcriptional regulator [Actinotalea sp.]
MRNLSLVLDLRLDDQLCFALYAASRATTKAYREALDDLGLTYPQYLVMLVLWEQDGATVGELGARLRLDSGTLSPLLARLDSAGLVVRSRPARDTRLVLVHLTDAGRGLRSQAERVQCSLLERLQMPTDEIEVLHRLARRLASSLSD